MTPYQAYGQTAKMAMSDREIEASALTKAALLLRECRDQWCAPDRDSRLAEALEFNQRLWSIFQSELAKPDHPMAVELRRDLLNLSIFVDKRTFDAIAYPAPEKLSVLIDINLNLAAGLRENRAPEAEAPAPDPPSGHEYAEASLWA